MIRRFADELQSKTMIRPAFDQPFHISDNGVDILDLFLGRIGVVHAQVALAAEFAGDAEIQANGFCVANVQVAALGFGQENA